jgi:DNA-binding response OmpR family regulator
LATKILIIEDTTELARTVQRELEREGYQVSMATDGQSGLEKFVAVQPDLVLLDWKLPVMDGLEVLRRIRQVSAVPVLMLTARQEEIDRVIGLEVGADDYLTKPFGMRELIARIHALLRRLEHVQQILAEDRTAAAISDTLTYQGLALNATTHEVFLAGEPVDLTRTEFSLLHLFLRNPGVVFNRDYLLDTIWGVKATPGDRSVDSAIVRLRKKLGPLGERVETVWGVGYRFARR